MAESDPIREGSVPSGASPEEAQISRLDPLIDKLKVYFENKKFGLQVRLLIWIVVTVFLILSLWCFYHKLLSSIEVNTKDKTPIQFIYEMAIRITFISLVTSVIVFCLKIVRSYLHIYEKLQHRMLILDCIPTMVSINVEGVENKATYNRLLEAIIHYGNTGIIAKEEKEANESMSSILDVIKKISGKE